MTRKTHGVVFREADIDALFAELDQCQLPGAVVGIAIDGRPVYRKGFGLASMELPVVLSPTIRMRINSTTKHFACLAYMLLCEEGLADVDDPIGRFLPELHPVTGKVTMRQLMGHVGGLRDALDIKYQFSGTGRPVSSAAVFSLYRDIDDVNFPPGTSWCYCNGGFLILTVVIERITGRPLEEVLQERIFAPVGLHDSLLRRVDTDFVPNSATMHMTSSTGGFDRSYLGTECAGEGGIVSTVDDMLRWLAHMDAPSVGSAATWALMKSPQRLSNGASTGYGFGLSSSRYRGVEVLHHAGGGMGANSQMLKVPAAGLDVVVMVNRHDVSASELVNAILDACLANLDVVEHSAFRPVAKGTYVSSVTGRVIRLRDSVVTPQCRPPTQQIAVIDGFDVPVETDGHVLRPGGPFEFLKMKLTLMGETEKPTSISLDDFGNRDELQSVPPPEAADEEPIAGSYRSATTGSEATISRSDEGARLITTGRFGSAQYNLECLSAGIWRARSRDVMPWGGILSFDTRHTVFHFSNLRTRALPFRRVV